MSTQLQTRPAPAPTLPGQVRRFALIGAASTAANLALFALFSLAVHRQVANLAALVICTVFNTAANRRFTFAASRQGALAVQLRSLALLAITWVATAGALWILHTLAPGANTLVATVTVGIGNATATVVRFVLLRRWFAN